MSERHATVTTESPASSTRFFFFDDPNQLFPKLKSCANFVQTSLPRTLPDCHVGDVQLSTFSKAISAPLTIAHQDHNGVRLSCGLDKFWDNATPPRGCLTYTWRVHDNDGSVVHSDSDFLPLPDVLQSGYQVKELDVAAFKKIPITMQRPASPSGPLPTTFTHEVNYLKRSVIISALTASLDVLKPGDRKGGGLVLVACNKVPIGRREGEICIYDLERDVTSDPMIGDLSQAESKR